MLSTVSTAGHCLRENSVSIQSFICSYVALNFPLLSAEHQGWNNKKRPEPVPIYSSPNTLLFSYFYSQHKVHFFIIIFSICLTIKAVCKVLDFKKTRIQEKPHSACKFEISAKLYPQISFCLTWTNSPVKIRTNIIWFSVNSCLPFDWLNK